MPNHPKIVIPNNYWPSITVYSQAKLGKTLLTLTATQRDKLLILDAQHGTDWMDHPRLRPHVWHIEKYSDWEEAYEFLRKGDHPYKWVSNDTINKLHNLALRKAINAEGDKPLPSGISQPRRGAAGEYVKLMIDRFRKLPMGVIYVANERYIDLTMGDNSDRVLLDSEELGENHSVAEAGLEETVTPIKWVPDLPQDTRKYLVAETDIIGRIYTVSTPNRKRAERRLWLAPHPNFETGYRSYYQLPDYLAKPDYSIKKLVTLATRGQE